LRLGIVSIAFNSAELILKQLETFKSCTDDYDFIIIDNSNDDASIKYHAEINNCEYAKIHSHEGSPSLSHSFAADFAWIRYKAQYDVLFFVDHDLFPIKPFSIFEMLGENNLMGLSQERKGVKYLWPGCLALRTSLDGVDFAPVKIRHQQLDTGGSLHRLLKQPVRYLSEEYHNNPHVQDAKSFYAVLEDTFMHFIKGSNWNHQTNHTQRLNSLFNILEQRRNESRASSNSNGEVL